MNLSKIWTKTAHCLSALSVTALVSAFWVDPASAQGADIDILQLKSAEQCRPLVSRLRGTESGGQWLIGSNIEIYGRPNGRTPIHTRDDLFDRVSCYGRFAPSGASGSPNRVFVSSFDGQTCGWVDNDDLLNVNRRGAQSALDIRRSAVCEVPRAMFFQRFCDALKSLRPNGEEHESCIGVPAGLRAKGILTGSTGKASATPYPFMSAPKGGKSRAERVFFSVLEIHDVALGDAGKIMVLVGDGEGEIFGWIDLDAIELWPTRLGLFYDTAGKGALFQRQRDLIANWRSKQGKPEADVESGMTPPELTEYVDGKLQLLSYPIISTVDDRLTASSNSADTPFHQVIFLGQTGEGSASQILAQAEFANRVEAVQRLNLLILLDTTESMRVYLPLVQQGISQFILDYESRSLDRANRLPDLRIAIYGYSDFVDAKRTGLNDKISNAIIMPPTRVGAGRDLTKVIERISSHKGLDDTVGLREEAALESVALVSREFGRGKAWFDNGPRVIIHMADHGSRSDDIVDDVLAKLNANLSLYLPIAVITKDVTPSSKTAREAFMRQAVRMLSPLVDEPTEEDVARIDLQNFREKTPAAVSSQMSFVLDEIISTVNDVRGGVVGERLADSSRRTQDRAASRINLQKALKEQFDLNQVPEETIVQASTAFAPLFSRKDGVSTEIDWTYTVALEVEQARSLKQGFETMCRLVGSPEQDRAFRTLIVNIAEVFSGDKAIEDKQVRGILSDMRSLPGADQSFLSQKPQILLQRSKSTDVAIIDELRRDVCWISYHLGNMGAGLYARPDQVVWSGREFRLAPGEEVIKREYLYKPVIGAEIYYLPSFFFVLPSIVEREEEEDTECIFCK